MNILLGDRIHVLSSESVHGRGIPTFGMAVKTRSNHPMKSCWQIIKKTKRRRKLSKIPQLEHVAKQRKEESFYEKKTEKQRGERDVLEAYAEKIPPTI